MKCSPGISGWGSIQHSTVNAPVHADNISQASSIPTMLAICRYLTYLPKKERGRVRNVRMNDWIEVKGNLRMTDLYMMGSIL